MKRFVLFLAILNIPLIQSGQIIADHTVVEKYDDIPQFYIDKVKKMRFVIAGESHALGILHGLDSLERLDSRYKVETQLFAGLPDPYTTSDLRASRAMWGDLNNDEGWIYGFGEEDWWTSELARSRTKAGILYCKNNSLTIDALAFGMCYDVGVNYSDYIAATKEYIGYCKDNRIATKVIFSTGTVDGYGASEIQYIKSQAYDMIRTTVINDPTGILFDYADILCYDNNGNLNTVTWNGHTFPNIADENLIPTLHTGHISSAGAIRLGKAVWWMMARIAGWDGDTLEAKQDELSKTIKVITDNFSDEIRIECEDIWSSGTISLYNTNGNLMAADEVTDGVCVFSKSGFQPGVYIIKVLNGKLCETKRLIIIR